MNKKTTISLVGLIISLGLFLSFFFVTDNLLGEKLFSFYTADDWEIATMPLVMLGISGVSTLVFIGMIIIPLFRLEPRLSEYVSKMKFADLEENTEFLVFDHNELKRACCYYTPQKEIWFSVKEYNLQERSWNILEKGRTVCDAESLHTILHTEYGYDEIKAYFRQDT